MCVHRACVEIDRLTHASMHACMEKCSLSLSHTHTHREEPLALSDTTPRICPCLPFWTALSQGTTWRHQKRPANKRQMRARIHTHMHARTNERTRAHTHTHTHTCTHMHTHTSMSTQTHISHVCLCCLRTYIDIAMHRSQTCTRVPATMSAASVPPPSDSESGRLLCFF